MLARRSASGTAEAAAARIAAMLPDRHPARLWARGADDPVDRAALIDLGDESAVKEVYGWMPKPERT
jgi:hypothetical protein